MHRSAEFSLKQMADAFIWLTNMPLREMWFINTLFFFFLLFPIYQAVSEKLWLQIMLLVGLFLLSASKVEFTSFLFDFQTAPKYAFYFWGGFLASKYSLSKFLDNPLSLLCTTSLFFTMHYFSFEFPAQGIVIALLGIASSVSFSYQIAKKWPTLFSTFRAYTFQIFLLGIFLQIITRIAVEKFSLESHVRIAVLYPASIILGLAVPVLISRIILRLPNVVLVTLIKRSIGLR